MHKTQVGREGIQVKKLTRSEYNKLNAIQKLLYKIVCFICAIPSFFARIGVAIWKGIKVFGKAVKNEILDVILTFKNGTWKTRVSYLIMGFGNIARKQFARGFIFLAFEGAFIYFMSKFGIPWLSKLDNLGDYPPQEIYDPILDTFYTVYYENSFDNLFYALIAMALCFAFVITWRMNVKQNKIADELLAKGKKLPTFKQDLRGLVDEKFHKTLLSVPVLGVTIFTIMPIIFMIFIAFTNYDGSHDGFSNLFTWVGWDNFRALFDANSSDKNLGYTFIHILGWTLVWAVFATFTNYFLGMLVAILINKKGIRFKKLWRSILVMTIAVPQFVSLLYVSKLFAKNGIVNAMLMKLGITDHLIDFWGTTEIARVLVIVINIWIGIPYLMLIATGILMNIPEDLYESSKIDGANPFQQFMKITLPYMLFVTGPYLLTSFIGNINNFNVIYLLTTGGTMSNPKLNTSGGVASDTDLLVTWLFNITQGALSNYKLAAVIAIMIFVVVATLSLIVYNIMPSTKNEEDFQ